MNKEFEIDKDGNVKETFGDVMKALGKNTYKKKTETKEQFAPKKGVLFVDILEVGCYDCPCCDTEQTYCTVLPERPECEYKKCLPECPIKEITITPEEFAKRMQEIGDRYSGDEETSHSMMDDLMCNLLIELGYGEGIDIFDHTSKWYA